MPNFNFRNVAGTNRLTIDSSGNVGIGSGSPFSVNSAGAITAATGITTTGNFTLSGSSANVLLGANFLSGDGGDEGISVDSSGNVNILQDQLSICSGGGCASAATVDGQVTAEAAITSEESSVTAGTNRTVDWDNGNQQYLSLTSNTNIQTFSNATNGQTLRLVACQDGTGGRTFTFDAGLSIKWAGGTTPTQTSTANKCDVYSFIKTTAGTLGAFNQNF
jgi:hypothetical protein